MVFYIAFIQLIKTNYLHKHTLKYNKIIKTKKEQGKSEDYTMYMTTLLFTNFTVAVPKVSVLIQCTFKISFTCVEIMDIQCSELFASYLAILLHLTLCKLT